MATKKVIVEMTLKGALSSQMATVGKSFDKVKQSADILAKHVGILKNEFSGLDKTPSNHRTTSIKKETAALEQATAAQLRLQNAAKASFSMFTRGAAGSSSGPIPKISSDTAKLSTDLKAAQNRYKKLGKVAKSSMEEAAGGAKKTTNSIRGLTAVLVKNYLAYLVLQKVIGTITDELTAGFKAVEDFKTSVAATAGFITTFSAKAKAGDIAGAYKEAYAYSKKLNLELMKMSARTIATGSDLQLISQAFIKNGVLLDVNNKKQKEGFLAVSTALKAMFAGTQNASMQMNQEISALMRGQSKASDKLAQTLKAEDPLLESHLRKWKSTGKVLEHLKPLLAGFLLSSDKLMFSWSTIGSTLETINVRILREGFKPIVNDILHLVQNINASLVDTETGDLTAKARQWQNEIKTVYKYIKLIMPDLAQMTEAWLGIKAAMVLTNTYLAYRQALTASAVAEQEVLTAAVGETAAAQEGLNVVTSANPYIMLITAAVGAFILLKNHVFEADTKITALDKKVENLRKHLKSLNIDIPDGADWGPNIRSQMADLIGKIQWIKKNNRLPWDMYAPPQAISKRVHELTGQLNKLMAPVRILRNEKILGLLAEKNKVPRLTTHESPEEIKAKAGAITAYAAAVRLEKTAEQLSIADTKKKYKDARQAVEKYYNTIYKGHDTTNLGADADNKKQLELAKLNTQERLALNATTLASQKKLDDTLKKLSLNKYDYERYLLKKEVAELRKNGVSKISIKRLFALKSKKITADEAKHNIAVQQAALASQAKILNSFEQARAASFTKQKQAINAITAAYSAEQNALDAYYNSLDDLTTKQAANWQKYSEGLDKNEAAEKAALIKKVAVHQASAIKIDSLWDHAFNDIADHMTSWIKDGKADLAGLVDTFETSVARMVSTWLIGQAKMAFTGQAASPSQIAAGNSLGIAALTASGSMSAGSGLVMAAASGAHEFLNPGSYAGSLATLQDNVAMGLTDLSDSLDGAATTIGDLSTEAMSAWTAGIGTFVIDLLQGDNFKHAAASGIGAGGGAYLGAEVGSAIPVVGTAIGAIVGSALGAIGLGSIFGGDKEHTFTLSELSQYTSDKWQPGIGIKSSSFQANPSAGNKWYHPVANAYIAAMNATDSAFNKQVQTLKAQMSAHAWQAFSKALTAETFADANSGRWGISNAKGAITSTITAYSKELTAGLNAALLAALPVMAEDLTANSSGFAVLNTQMQAAINSLIHSSSFNVTKLKELKTYLDKVKQAETPIREALATHGLTTYALQIRRINQQFAAYGKTLQAAGVDLSKYTDFQKAHNQALNDAALAHAKPLLIDAVNATIAAVNKTVSTLHNAVSSLSSSASQMVLNANSSDAYHLAQGKLDTMLRNARAGNFNDLGELNDTLGNLTKLNKNSYRTVIGYKRDFLHTRNSILSLLSLTKTQETAADKTLENLKSQLAVETDLRDNSKDLMVKQLNALLQINNSIISTPAVTSAYTTASSAVSAVPGYANGGSFPGGYRLVGEYGPELEHTAPSHIFSNATTKSLLDTSDLLFELRQLRQVNSEMRQELLSIRKTNRRISDITEKTDAIGPLPARAA